MPLVPSLPLEYSLSSNHSTTRMVDTGKLYAHLGVPSNISPALATSPVLSPLGLAGTRLLFTFYTITTSIIIFVHNTFYTPFTNLSYIGLVSYNCASAFQTSVYALRWNGTFPLQRWPRILLFMHILPYSTITTFGGRTSNIAQRAMTSLFAVFEILSTNVRPAPGVNVVFLEVFLAYITKSTEGFYNPQANHALPAAYIAGIGVDGALVFAVVKGFVTLRVRICQGRGGEEWAVEACEE
ncbi:hypothetical protein FIBSPDRAFT_1043949 [Athelia psychrophila]|uniref:Uncharacterized protein n=1 Tax=Athelia psychrophila TaxID=1759441 RepID=A0A166KGI4_9AGAM|nr:hypothetical protein FIBSPDRAFT_1043949 [Fibularhizoctonia sp. CBS 109695]